MFPALRHNSSDSDGGDDDQWERIQKADVRPGMFVSGWEDPNDEVDEDTDPQGSLNIKQLQHSNANKRVNSCPP